MDTQEIMFKNGSIWVVGTSTWTGKDKLLPQDLGISAEQVDDNISLGRKELLDKSWRIRLNRARGMVVSLMNEIGESARFLKSAWFVPDRNFLVAKEGLERVAALQAKVVEDLIEVYEQIKAERIERHPNLRDAAWLTPDKIRSQFNVKWYVFEITNTTVSEADPEEILQVKREFQEELREALDETKEMFVREAQVAIVDVCEAITNQIIIEDPQKITETTLKKPKKLIKKYLDIAAIFDAGEIKAEVEKLKTLLDETEAKTIRKDWEVARNFAKALEKAGDSIGDLSGINKEGRVKRKVAM
jgi:hypothetical protein